MSVAELLSPPMDAATQEAREALQSVTASLALADAASCMTGDVQPDYALSLDEERSESSNVTDPGASAAVTRPPTPPGGVHHPSSSADSDDESSHAGMGGCLTHHHASSKGAGIMKRAWQPEEDQQLLQLVTELGPCHWSVIAGYLEGRVGKQCRERWHNHLCPNVRKEEWSPEEDRMVMELVQRYGTKWSKIVKMLPGRTDNAIKNRWNSTMRKNLRRQLKEAGSEPHALTKPPPPQPVLPPHQQHMLLQTAALPQPVLLQPTMPHPPTAVAQLQLPPAPMPLQLQSSMSPQLPPSSSVTPAQPPQAQQLPLPTPPAAKLEVSVPYASAPTSLKSASSADAVTAAAAAVTAAAAAAAAAAGATRLGSPRPPNGISPRPHAITPKSPLLRPAGAASPANFAGATGASSPKSPASRGVRKRGGFGASQLGARPIHKVVQAVAATSIAPELQAKIEAEQKGEPLPPQPPPPVAAAGAAAGTAQGASPTKKSSPRKASTRSPKKAATSAAAKVALPLALPVDSAAEQSARQRLLESDQLEATDMAAWIEGGGIEGEMALAGADDERSAGEARWAEQVMSAAWISTFDDATPLETAAYAGAEESSPRRHEMAMSSHDVGEAFEVADAARHQECIDPID